MLLAALAGSDAGSLSAGELLAHGAVVWLTNIITFGLLFWMLDEGGPRVRAERGRHDPDFQFPQDASRRSDWSPRLSDYLYVSLTNAIAVSPTDTMPLTRRAKGLMAVESLISYAVVILVVARAVNVLGYLTITITVEPDGTAWAVGCPLLPGSPGFVRRAPCARGWCGRSRRSR